MVVVSKGTMRHLTILFMVVKDSMYTYESMHIYITKMMVRGRNEHSKTLVFFLDQLWEMFQSRIDISVDPPPRSCYSITNNIRITIAESNKTLKYHLLILFHFDYLSVPLTKINSAFQEYYNSTEETNSLQCIYNLTSDSLWVVTVIDRKLLIMCFWLKGNSAYFGVCVRDEGPLTRSKKWLVLMFIVTFGLLLLRTSHLHYILIYLLCRWINDWKSRNTNVVALPYKA